MAERYNEGKAIDAVLRRIEAREASARLNDGRSPDDLKHSSTRALSRLIIRLKWKCITSRFLLRLSHVSTTEPRTRNIGSFITLRRRQMVSAAARSSGFKMR